MHLTNSVYIQPKFGDFADLRILNEFEMAVEIRKSLSIVISFMYRYDGRPPSEVKKSDLELRNGLRISF